MGFYDSKTRPAPMSWRSKILHYSSSLQKVHHAARQKVLTRIQQDKILPSAEVVYNLRSFGRQGFGGEQNLITHIKHKKEKAFR